MKIFTGIIITVISVATISCDVDPLVTFGNYVASNDGNGNSNVCALDHLPDTFSAVSCNVDIGTHYTISGNEYPCGFLVCAPGPASVAVESITKNTVDTIFNGEKPNDLICLAYIPNTSPVYTTCIQPANSNDCRMLGEPCTGGFDFPTTSQRCCEPTETASYDKLVCGVTINNFGTCCLADGEPCVDDSDCCNMSDNPIILPSVCGVGGGADGATPENIGKCCLLPGAPCTPDNQAACCSGNCYTNNLSINSTGECDDGM